MGIIIRQSFKNTLSTYLGFGIGAVNTLFLYTHFLTETYYGLVGYLISIANIMTPLLTFGVHNSLVKFFSSYTSEKEQNRFVTLMFFLPLTLILPAGIVGLAASDWITALLSGKNPIAKPYLWITYVIAFSMAYFEVFYAWAKVHLKSVFGNFLKEVFHRIAITGMLLMVFLEWLTVSQFIYGIAVVYLVRMGWMLLSALLVKKPVFVWRLPANTREVLSYSGFIILAGSIAIVLLDIDTFMIGQFRAVENVAFYNVAIFIAMVIVVPSRAMHQILYPITAKLLNENDLEGLKNMYKRSSLTLYVIGGLIFLLILSNANEIYHILPPSYRNGITVIFLIALAKLSDMLMGNNNAILFNSRYYKTVLFFGVLLAGVTIVLNLLFIPIWGINGAALATLLGFLIYNTAKIGFVHKKFRIHPFTPETIQTTLLIAVFLPAFYFWNFPFHPVINILLKSGVLGVLYGVVVLKLKLSEDITQLARQFLTKKNG